MSVFVVDDEKIIRDGLCQHIPWNELGFCLAGSASSGSEALEACKKIVPDLVITDIRMSGMSGLDFVEKLKTVEPGIRFIIISGYEEFSYAQKAVSLGVEEYMLKPIYKPDLVTVLDRVRNKFLEERDKNWQSENSVTSGTTDSAVFQVTQYIATEYRDATLVKAAEYVSLTPEYLSTLFRDTMNISFHDHLQAVRMKNASYLLLNTQLKCYEVASRVGYTDAEYFSKIFRQYYGYSPKECKKGVAACEKNL